MQALHRSTSSPASIPVVTSQPPRGLFAKWETIDGKLMCKWVKFPD